MVLCDAVTNQFGVERAAVESVRVPFEMRGDVARQEGNQAQPEQHYPTNHRPRHVFAIRVQQGQVGPKPPTLPHTLFHFRHQNQPRFLIPSETRAAATKNPDFSVLQKCE